MMPRLIAQRELAEMGGPVGKAVLPLDNGAQTPHRLLSRGALNWGPRELARALREDAEERAFVAVLVSSAFHRVAVRAQDP